jgi:hypothetical protein
MIFFVVPDDSFFSIADYLENQGRPIADRLDLVFYPELVYRRKLRLGTYVFCALDRLTEAEREITLRAWEALSATGCEIRLLNHPTKTLLRYDLLRKLYETGINRFQAYRASETRRPKRYPVFLRLENEHLGDIGGLLHNQAQIYAALARARLLGYRIRDLLIVEFCDTADRAGFYRKYSAFIVGDEVLARFSNVSRRWMVKAEGQHMDESTVMDERRFICENPHGAALREVFRRGNVDFGRVDYSMLDGKVQIWEVNLGPTIGRGPLANARSPLMEKYRPLREFGRQHFYRGFQTALEKIDSTVDPRREISLALPDSLVRQYKKEKQQARRALFHRNTVERVRYSSWTRLAKRLVTPSRKPDVAVSLPAR